MGGTRMLIVIGVLMIFASPVVLILGMISPRLVLPKVKTPDRPKAFVAAIALVVVGFAIGKLGDDGKRSPITETAQPVAQVSQPTATVTPTPEPAKAPADAGVTVPAPVRNRFDDQAIALTRSVCPQIENAIDDALPTSEAICLFSADDDGRYQLTVNTSLKWQSDTRLRQAFLGTLAKAVGASMSRQVLADFSTVTALDQDFISTDTDRIAEIADVARLNLDLRTGKLANASALGVAADNLFAVHREPPPIPIDAPAK